MDGNFGLVRKKSSGQSVEPPKHGTRVFLSDETVREVISSCTDDGKLGEGVCFLSSNMTKFACKAHFFGPAHIICKGTLR